MLPPKSNIDEIPGLNKFYEALAARRPGVFVMTYYHDDGCPAMKTFKTDDCRCNPDVDVKEVGMETGRESQA